MTATTGATSFSVTVAPEAAGARLDRLLADALPTLSRSRIQALIHGGHVALAGTALADPSRKARRGEVFTVTVPPAVAAAPEAQAIALDIVYEDSDLVVIDKPAGLVVHPGAGNPDRTLVNALLAHCAGSLSGIGGVERPGIVHRLDKDTSGLMVAAKTDLAHQSLAGQFAAHDLERAYKAVVWGVPSPAEGSITGNVGRSPRNRQKMAVVTRGGKTALTHYKVLRVLGPSRVASLVECRLATGRTHQIRVHMSHAGHPLVGDPLYGAQRRRGVASNLDIAFDRQALHAYLIGFRHPRDGRILRFLSELPSDINSLLELLDGI